VVEAASLQTLKVVEAGVVWPRRADPLPRLTGEVDFAQWGLLGGLPTSDHRSVWIDVRVPTAR
jgi:hypothetical protein